MSQIARVVQGRATQITFAFTQGGQLVDPAGQSATVQILRGDGAELVAAGTNAPRISQGIYSYTLTPTQTALLDRLDVVWAATLDSYAQTFRTVVEVAGAVLFDLAAARGKLNSGSAITDVEIQDVRVVIEQSLEEAIECALVPRWERQRLDGNGDKILFVDWPRVSEIRAVTINGTALTSDEILDQISFSGRIIERSTSWPEGRGNIVVDYEHGYPLPPGRAVRAGLLLAQDWLQQGPGSERATTFSSVDGGTYALMVAGIRGAIFGLPEAEAFIEQYDHHTPFG